MCVCLLAEVQKQAAKALQQGKDVLIHSQTGSGKTLAFLLPLLSALQYPPEVYPDDLKVDGLPCQIGSDLDLYTYTP